MAERLNKRQADAARQLISVQRIIQELHRCVDGERNMKSTEIRAAEILLNKSLPNLTATDVTSKGEALPVYQFNAPKD